MKMAMEDHVNNTPEKRVSSEKLYKVDTDIASVQLNISSLSGDASASSSQPGCVDFLPNICTSENLDASIDEDKQDLLDNSQVSPDTQYFKLSDKLSCLVTSVQSTNVTDGLRHLAQDSIAGLEDCGDIKMGSWKEKAAPLISNQPSSLIQENTDSGKDGYLVARFNPFDKEMEFEDDHYSEVDSISSAGSHAWSYINDPFLSTNSEISYAELGLAEDHFSHPLGHFGLSSQEEIEMAIRNCKELIMTAQPLSIRQKQLIEKLVQLQMNRQQLMETPEEVDPDIKMVMSHRFKARVDNIKHPCEKCKGLIWGMVQKWYRCQACGYCCHSKCINQVTRLCAYMKVGDANALITKICPERGLTKQRFRCADCRTLIEFNTKRGCSEPRQCDYTGDFYCDVCHWNDEMVIPARVIHNWDFEPRKVCRASRQFLKLLMKKPILQIENFCPLVFTMSEELGAIKKIRKNILMVKKYLVHCSSALTDKLLLRLSYRQHFVDSADMYSLQDLVDTHTMVLRRELSPIYEDFLKHIQECLLCRAKGYICEICQSEETLFPFEDFSECCPDCSQVFHRTCYTKMQACPRCERRAHRLTSE